MLLHLYKTVDDPNVLNKTLENPFIITGDLKGEFNTLRNVIDVELSDPSYNYLYFPATNGYYFITQKTHINREIIRLYLSCDVLMTYKNMILNSRGLVIKGNNVDMYYPAVTHTSKRIVRTIDFSRAFPYYNQENFILTVIKAV